MEIAMETLLRPETIADEAVGQARVTAPPETNREQENMSPEEAARRFAKFQVRIADGALSARREVVQRLSDQFSQQTRPSLAAAFGMGFTAAILLRGRHRARRVVRS
jgi:hypothetical protein